MVGRSAPSVRACVLCLVCSPEEFGVCEEQKQNLHTSACGFIFLSSASLDTMRHAAGGAVCNCLADSGWSDAVAHYSVSREYGATSSRKGVDAATLTGDARRWCSAVASGDGGFSARSAL